MPNNKEQGTKQWEISEREFRQIFIGSGFYISPQKIFGLDCLAIADNQSSVCAVYLPDMTVTDVKNIYGKLTKSSSS